MTAKEALDLIKKGEGITIEFKKSTNEINKDVYDTVCSFSNRNGGHIFLGVNDQGKIIGVDPDSIDRLKKEFITTVNNVSKMYPPLYLTPEEIKIGDATIIHIFVPVGTQVCRHNGRIFDRSHESDLDITNNSDAVYRLYSRKQDTFYVNKVTSFGMDDLRHDIIDRARKMSRLRNDHHPWLSMNDEELLRSAGLILKDPESKKEGITLAAILLFGKDITIMSAIPQHKTDAIFRVKNLDRYDDRDVIITNLFDTYDRLMEFGAKHLSSPFVLEGISSINVRDKILREIFSNFLAHRDYSSAFIAKFVIEQNRMYTENANKAHGVGILDLNSFEPFPKNPAISKVFRETTLADELGSGMRNTFKYTKLYSGGIPEFIEGDIFKTIVPFNEVSIGMVGPELGLSISTPQDEHKKDENTPQDEINTPQDRYSKKFETDRLYTDIISFCKNPKTKVEIASHFNFKDLKSFTKKYLKPLLNNGHLRMTLPDKPTSGKQRYVSTRKSS